MGGDALAASGKSQSLLGSGFDTDLIYRHVQINRRISPEIESILSEGGEWKNETIKRVVKEYRRKQEV